MMNTMKAMIAVAAFALAIVDLQAQDAGQPPTASDAYQALCAHAPALSSYKVLKITPAYILRETNAWNIGFLLVSDAGRGGYSKMVTADVTFQAGHLLAIDVIDFPANELTQPRVRRVYGHGANLR